jgi:hypothetical protein
VMPDDLPIYPDNVMLRSGMQFADLLRWRDVDTAAIWAKADGFIASMEGAVAVDEARAVLAEPTKDALLRAHRILFAGQPSAGQLRQTLIAGRYRGQDCPEPQFIDRSLDNFFMWMSAESLAEIHPIEKAALVLTRIVDIWPFDVGNLTTAVVLANAFLAEARLAPFFVIPQHMPEFDKIVAQAVTIETQPLVNAIYRTIKQEMETLAPRSGP